MMLVSHDRRIPKTPNAVATSGAMRIQCGSMFSISPMSLPSFSGSPRKNGVSGN